MSDTQDPPTDDSPTSIPDPDFDKASERAEIPISRLEAGDDPAPVIRPDNTWIGTGRFGAFSELRQLRKRQKKRKRMARQGYVEWYLIDGTFPGPEYVKPTADGGGIPDLEHDGGTYVFPPQAAVPSTVSGMRCYVHREGEMDPINLHDPVSHAQPPDQAQEYQTSALQTTSPSGWFGDWSSGDMIFWGAILMVALVVAYVYISGGGL